MPVQSSLQKNSQSNSIKSISNLVNSSKNSSKMFLYQDHSKQNQQKKFFLTRCPHVVLIGNVYIEDLDLTFRLNVQHQEKIIEYEEQKQLVAKLEKQLNRKKKSKTKKKDVNATDNEKTDKNLNENESVSDENDEENNDDNLNDQNEEEKEENNKEIILNELVLDDHLKCDECEQRKNLWLCLREDCMFVGCGCDKDEKSLKHSTLHAQTCYHPLSINLNTQAVWCELCNNRIVLEQNNPPYYLKSKHESRLKQKAINSSSCNNQQFLSGLDTNAMLLNEEQSSHLDDLELISYLDQENDLENEDYENESNKIEDKLSSYFNGEDDDEDDEDNYHQKEKSRKRKTERPLPPPRNGLLGLDNLGNTCYMNAALQALSNCYAFTSYFLECSNYIETLMQLKAKNYSIMNNKSSMLPCLSVCYMKLMRELWQSPKRQANLGKNIKQISSLTPNELVQAIKYLNPMFRGYMQHDSQEFLIYLMDQLHEILKRPLYLSNEEINKDKECRRIKKVQNELNQSLEEESGDYEEEDDDDEEENAEDNENEEDLTVVSNNKLSNSISSKEIDSGIVRLSIKSSDSTRINISSRNKVKSNSLYSDDESADSFETCGGGDDDDFMPDKSKNDSAISLNDTSDNKLHFTDADESMPSSSPSSLSISHQNADFKEEKQNKNSNVKKKKLLKKKKNDGQAKKSKEERSSRPVYSSIVSELFEGKLIGQVQCLECLNVSTTTEPFLHLSLPIPTKEYLQALHTKLMNKKSNPNSPNGIVTTVQYQGWLSWMFDFMKGYIWSQTIKLTECLTAFFSDDDLKGENMYSCEKCKKLTNGVKYSKLLDLPETLIIHLKRFRHDSIFSTGKISSYVSFPLDDLDMRPFVHKDSKSELTQYDLNSIICHYGGSNGGHYTCYARNFFDEEWYEFDDSYCRKVDSLTVQNTQAYVLFYKKKSNKLDTIKEKLRSLIISKTSITCENSLLRPFYISKQWLHKLKHFSEPGPIDNTDFLCKHNLVQPNIWWNIESLVIKCSNDTWFFLSKNFGVKNQIQQDENTFDYNEQLSVCNYLYPCHKCQQNDELMKKRQIYEKNEFLRLTDRARLDHLYQNAVNTYAISSTWFKQWEQFVQYKQCPQSYQIPSKINNFPICLKQQQQQNPIDLKKNKITNQVFYLNKNSNHYRLNEEAWKFLYKIYGGGPELLINSSSNHLTQKSASMYLSSSQPKNLNRSNTTAQIDTSSPSHLAVKTMSNIENYLINKKNSPENSPINNILSAKSLLQVQETQL